MSAIVNAAICLAMESHQGDRNKHDGELYLLHVQRVAALVEARYDAGPTMLAVAWLHDTVEDTVTTLDDVYIAFLPYGFEVAAVIRDGVDGMTKRDGESNNDYYERVKENEHARKVKLCDMHDNFSRNHEIVDTEKALRLARKYSKGMAILGETA